MDDSLFVFLDHLRSLKWPVASLMSFVTCYAAWFSQFCYSRTFECRNRLCVDEVEIETSGFSQTSVRSMSFQACGDDNLRGRGNYMYMILAS